MCTTVELFQSDLLSSNIIVKNFTNQSYIIVTTNKYILLVKFLTMKSNFGDTLLVKFKLGLRGDGIGLGLSSMATCFEKWDALVSGENVNRRP